MHGSYRGIVAALGGITLFIAFSLGVYLTALAYGHYEHERAVAGQHSAADYAKHKHQADMDRAGLPSLAEQIISNPEPDEGTQREKRDLAAQEATATWAFWVVMLSGGQFILSAFGLYALLKTIQQGKESIAKATEANRIASIVSSAELRPYLFVEKVELENKHWTEYDVEPEEGEVVQQQYLSSKVVIRLRNAGKVPARNIRVHLRDYHADVFSGNFWDYRSVNIETGFCGPGHERRVFGRLFISHEDSEAFRHAAIDYVVRLRFSFQDDYGNTFHEKAGFRISGDDLDTFYLFDRWNVAEARKRRQQYELEYGESAGEEA